MNSSTSLPTAPLRVGIIGFGYWGPTLARNFSSVLDAELVGICEPSQDNRSRAQRLHRNVPVFKSYEKMFAEAGLDAVAIATPSSEHFGYAKKALQYGLHVLVEKPMTLNSQDGEELVSLAAVKEKTLMVDHTYLYASVFNEIDQLVTSGELGDLRHVSCQRRSLGLFQKHMNVAWDLAPHDLSMLTHLFGELPQSVSCNKRMSPISLSITPAIALPPSKAVGLNLEKFAK